MKIFRLVLLAILSSCSNQNESKLPAEDLLNQNLGAAKIKQSSLEDYFQTDQIKVDTHAHTIEVSIANSKLLQEKKAKMGSRWENPESWISVAATYQANLVRTGIDSLVYSVNMDEGVKNIYKYSYSVAQLQKANDYISICEQFATYLNDGDYKKVKALLSNEILDKYSDSQIKNFIKATFKQKRIERTELIGTKIVGIKYSFYMNFWYSSNQAHTYAFSFLEGDEKIGSIQIPK